MRSVIKLKEAPKQNWLFKLLRLLDIYSQKEQREILAIRVQMTDYLSYPQRLGLTLTNTFQNGKGRFIEKDIV